MEGVSMGMLTGLGMVLVAFMALNLICLYFIIKRKQWKWLAALIFNFVVSSVFMPMFVAVILPVVYLWKHRGYDKRARRQRMEGEKNE